MNYFCSVLCKEVFEYFWGNVLCSMNLNLKKRNLLRNKKFAKSPWSEIIFYNIPFSEIYLIIFSHHINIINSRKFVYRKGMLLFLYNYIGVILFCRPLYSFIVKIMRFSEFCIICLFFFSSIVKWKFFIAVYVKFSAKLVNWKISFQYSQLIFFICESNETIN